MSWYREIRILFTITSQIFFFSIWNIVTSMFFGNYVEHNIFIVSTIAVFVVQFLKAKCVKDYKHRSKQISAILVIISLVGIAISWIMLGSNKLLLNGIFIFGVNVIQHKIDEETLDYSTYKDRMIKSVIILIVLSTLTMISKPEIIDNLFRYYIFFIITGVILLRESRRFSYKIREGKTYLYNAMISLSIIIISFDKVYNFLMDGIRKVFLFIFSVFMKGLEVILDILLTVLNRPLQYLFNLVGDKFGENYEEVLQNIFINQRANQEEMIPFIPETKAFTALDFILKLLIFSLVLYILYKIFIGRKYKIKKNTDMVNEEREKIFIHKKRKNIFEDLIKRVTRRKRTNKEQIIDIYRDFEKITEQKEIFKVYMTSTQLSNVTKIHIDKAKELDHISIIYNEAKFSTHNIEEDKLRVMKSDYNEIKKEL